MAEFSVVIKKRADESDDYSDYDDNSRVVFYNDKSDVEYKETKQNRRKKTTKKKSTTPRKNTKKRMHPLSILTYQNVPVCQQALDNRIKTSVFKNQLRQRYIFLFLIRMTLSAVVEYRRLKYVCYPCYEHLMIQWKEYNKAGLPHSKRKYRDLNGE